MHLSCHWFLDQRHSNSKYKLPGVHTLGSFGGSQLGRKPKGLIMPRRSIHACSELDAAATDTASHPWAGAFSYNFPVRGRQSVLFSVISLPPTTVLFLPSESTARAPHHDAMGNRFQRQYACPCEWDRYVRSGRQSVPVSCTLHLHLMCLQKPFAKLWNQFKEQSWRKLTMLSSCAGANRSSWIALLSMKCPW